MTAPAVTAAEVTLSSLACAATTIAGGSSTSCTVTLSGPATATGAAVTLSSSNSAALTVPASVNVSANATSASFTANGNAVTVNQAAVVTATFGSTSKTVSLTVTPPSGLSTVFYLKADASELSAITNGAIVTAAVAPAGLTGKLNVFGSGSINFRRLRLEMERRSSTAASRTRIRPFIASKGRRSRISSS